MQSETLLLVDGRQQVQWWTDTNFTCGAPVQTVTALARKCGRIINNEVPYTTTLGAGIAGGENDLVFFSWLPSWAKLVRAGLWTWNRPTDTNMVDADLVSLRMMVEVKPGDGSSYTSKMEHYSNSGAVEQVRLGTPAGGMVALTECPWHSFDTQYGRQSMELVWQHLGTGRARFIDVRANGVAATKDSMAKCGPEVAATTTAGTVSLTVRLTVANTGDANAIYIPKVLIEAIG